jgi:hypothetical protein
LLFPTAGNPSGTQNVAYGFQPTIASGFYPLNQESQSTVSGSGTVADPYHETTVFSAFNFEEHAPALRVTETTQYVNGESQFVSKYVLKNVSTATLHFVPCTPVTCIQAAAMSAPDCIRKAHSGSLEHSVE